jgi:hypothetical protein
MAASLPASVSLMPMSCQSRWSPPKICTPLALRETPPRSAAKGALSISAGAAVSKRSLKAGVAASACANSSWTNRGVMRTWSTFCNRARLISRRLPRTESPTISAPVMTAVAATTPSTTAAFVRA